VSYLGQRVDDWATEAQEIIDKSPTFNFLELKPIFEEPHGLVHYVTRCKLIRHSIKVPLFVHLVCGIICLGSSASFHLLKDHSSHYHSTLARMDYAGISFMIAGSNTPPIYYSFYCEDMRCKIQN